MKVKITPIELKNQRPTKVHDFYYDLQDDVIELKFQFDADETVNDEEPALGTKNVKNYFHIFARKDRISGIEMAFIPDLSSWKVLISLLGFSNDVAMYFKTLTEAKEHFNRILEWWRPAK